MVRNMTAKQEMQETRDPWVGKIPWRREWQSTPVFLPGEFHGQRSLAGYSPWGCKEQDMTEQLTLSLSFWRMKRLTFTMTSGQQVSARMVLGKVG